MVERAEERAADADEQAALVEPVPARVPTRPSIAAFLRQNPRLVGAGALFVAGIVIVMLGWYGTARTNILSQQIPYIVSGGLLGLGLIVVAGFIASAHMIEARTEQMRRDLLRALEMLPAGGAPSNGAARPASAGEVFVLANGHSYHLAGCPIIEGKDTARATARDAIGRGLGMCKLCGPE